MKELVKVIEITEYKLLLSNSYSITHSHEPDCCETHYLDFDDLTLEDFKDLEFDLNGKFFKKIEDYGIELVPIKGHSVKIPGYGCNNGYYSTELKLVILDGVGDFIKEYDISECQDISG